MEEKTAKKTDKAEFPEEVFPYITKTWHWRRLVVCYGAASVIVASWTSYSPVRPYWDALDKAAFLLLNGSVAEAGWWQSVMAFTNTRVFDALSGALLVVILLLYAFFGRKGTLAWRGAGIAFLGIFLVLSVFLRRKLGIGEFDRASPSLDLEPFFNMHGVLGDLWVKTESGSCFPSDHANASFLFIPLLWALAGRKWGLAALALAPVLVAPRLFGGAHWITDILVGGTAFALLVASWALCTPLFYWGMRVLHVPAVWGLDLLSSLRDKIFRKNTNSI
ncbi:MAG: phosphatase PAP2 family protein [Alphaproteobacteria bacterium]|nr:MAG: phosphatase PAP2 family protein [Alphaproteobacteria bacterium]